MGLAFIHLCRIEQIIRKLDSHRLKLLDELWPDTGRSKPPFNLPVMIDAGLFESENFLHRYYVAFHSRDFLHAHHFSRTIRQTRELNDHVQSGRDVMPKGLTRQIKSRHGY